MIGVGKALLLSILRVPPQPSAPVGSEGSLEVFRASSSYLRYRLVLWGVAQAFSLLGLVIFDGIIVNRFRQVIPEWIAQWLWAFLAFAILAWMAGFVITGLMVTLDYEMRWYLVTDQCLRIREGLWSVREMTMTFANIQNISIERGPLQRLLGISDLKVKSAGGGGGSQGGGQGEGEWGHDLHVGFFRGIDNAEQLRDLMRRHQRRAQGSGLGDPDEPTLAPVAIEGDQADPVRTDPHELHAVLDDLRAEARALSTAARFGAARAGADG